MGDYNQQTTEMRKNIPVGGQNLSRSVNFNIERPEVSRTIRCNVSKAEGPLRVGDRGLLHSLYQATATPNQILGTSIFGSRHQEINTEAAVPLELTTVDMSLSTLYLHELHHRQVRYFLKKFNVQLLAFIYQRLI